MKSHSEEIELIKIKERIKSLNNDRSNLILKQLLSKPMIRGIPRVVFRKCGKSNCRCASGRPHGPYHALSINSDGRQKIVMIKKTDSDHVIKKAERYKEFQYSLAQIRKINKEIDSLLVTIKKRLSSPYP